MSKRHELISLKQTDKKGTSNAMTVENIGPGGFKCATCCVFRERFWSLLTQMFAPISFFPHALLFTCFGVTQEAGIRYATLF